MPYNSHWIFFDFLLISKIYWGVRLFNTYLYHHNDNNSSKNISEHPVTLQNVQTTLPFESSPYLNQKNYTPLSSEYNVFFEQPRIFWTFYNLPRHLGILSQNFSTRFPAASPSFNKETIGTMPCLDTHISEPTPPQSQIENFSINER